MVRAGAVSGSLRHPLQFTSIDRGRRCQHRLFLLPGSSSRALHGLVRTVMRNVGQRSRPVSAPPSVSCSRAESPPCPALSPQSPGQMPPASGRRIHEWLTIPLGNTIMVRARSSGPDLPATARIRCQNGGSTPDSRLVDAALRHWSVPTSAQRVARRRVSVKQSLRVPASRPALWGGSPGRPAPEPHPRTLQEHANARSRPPLPCLRRRHRRRGHGLLDPLPLGQGRGLRHRPPGTEPTDLRHHVAFRRPSAGATLVPQPHRPHPLLHLPLRRARRRDRAGDRLDRQGLALHRHQRGPARPRPAPGGAGAPVRGARAVHPGRRGEGALAADARGGRDRRGLVPRRRPGRPLRSVRRPDQGGQSPGRADSRAHRRDRHPDRRRADHRRRDGPRRGALRRHRTLRRAVEPQGGVHGRRRGPDLALRAFLSAHAAHRRHRRPPADPVRPCPTTTATSTSGTTRAGC